MVTFFELAFEEGEAKRIKELALDGAFEGAGTIDGIVAGVGDMAQGLGGEDQVEVLFFETGENALELDRDHVAEVLIAEAVEFYWGERCPEHEDGCPVCEGWRQYDNLTGERK